MYCYLLSSSLLGLLTDKSCFSGAHSLRCTSLCANIDTIVIVVCFPTTPNRFIDFSAVGCGIRGKPQYVNFEFNGRYSVEKSLCCGSIRSLTYKVGKWQG